MKISEEVTDTLIRYLEGDLSQEETRNVNWFIQNDNAWQLEYERLKRSRLQPDKNKFYPWKAELKATTGKKTIVGIRQLSAAAVLMILLLGGWATWLISQSGFDEGFGRDLNQTDKLALNKLPLTSYKIGEVAKQKLTEPQKAPLIKNFEKAKELRSVESRVAKPIPEKQTRKPFKNPTILKPDDPLAERKANKTGHFNLPDFAPNNCIAQNLKKEQSGAMDDDNRGLLKTLLVNVFNVNKNDKGADVDQYQFKLEGDQHQITGIIEGNNLRLTGNIEIN